MIHLFQSGLFFSPGNESRKAAKCKGGWAHQQTDKITPWTIVSLSVVEDVGESDSKLWKDRIGVSMSYKVALREGWIKFPWKRWNQQLSA